MDVHVPGHEGIGSIVKLGSGVGDRRRIGQRVGVKWINETCKTCDICQKDETLCPDQHNSGRDTPGTLQEESKRRFCLDMGASHFFSFTDPEIEQGIHAITGHGGAHAIVCCAGAEAGYNQAPRLLRRGAIHLPHIKIC
ncbi:hypothetical protein SEUCBS140593_006766 [Sporothrix eucalyptigena]|uniref:Alcohol dehydrogenase-like N-terminal domain-containing protein n=1 Tax=Sporothrix eucalyptigena TaxID=1812306 RepID=A0ABP0C8M8_9PEZI